MPNTKSAEKALRKSIKLRKKNIAATKVLNATIKNFKKSPNPESLSVVYKKLDKAAKVNLIKKNKADRLKSRLSKLLKIGEKA